MTLSEKRETVLKRMPIVESQVRRSKDGKYMIHRTIITQIKPMSYYKAVLENKEEPPVDELSEDVEN